MRNARSKGVATSAAIAPVTGLEARSLNRGMIPSSWPCFKTGGSVALFPLPAIGRIRRFAGLCGRLEFGEPVGHHGICLGGAHGIAGDGGDELLALEGVELDVHPRRAGGDARHVLQERDLAEVVPAAECGDVAGVLLDVHETR